MEETSPNNVTPPPQDRHYKPPSPSTMERSATELLPSLAMDSVLAHHDFLEFKSKAEDQLCLGHIQVRNTISCHISGCVFYATFGGITKLQSKTNKIDLIPLTFHVVTLASCHEYLVAGGPLGELFVYDLQQEQQIFLGRVTKGGQNNAFTFHRVPGGQIHLIVGNNSPAHAIQVYELPSVKCLQIIKCPTQANRTRIGAISISPDRRWLAAAGDTCEIFLLKVTGTTYQLHNQIQVPGNCHGISWAPNSLLFAVACEAGYAIMLNIQGEIIHAYPAHGKTPDFFNQSKHAVSTVRFSPDLSRPLLAFGQAHVMNIVSYDPYDKGAFEAKRQFIKTSFPDVFLQTTIVGFDWDLYGNLVFGFQGLVKEEEVGLMGAGTPKKSNPKTSGRICVYRNVEHLLTLRQLAVCCIKSNRNHFIKQPGVEVMSSDMYQELFD